LPYLPDSLMAQVTRFLRTEARKGGGQPPATLFLGSSRFHSCILPQVFADTASQFGVDMKFLNAAMPTMEYWEFMRLLPHVDLKALGVKICVIEINPWSFNKQQQYSLFDPYYRAESGTWGTLRDTLDNDRILVKLKLCYLLTFPRRTFKDWYFTLRAFCGKGGDEDHLPGPEYHYNREKESKLRTDPVHMAVNIVEVQMLNYRFCKRKRAEFDDFLKRLEAKGITVVLAEPPITAGYYDFVWASREKSAEYQKHLDYLAELSKRYTTVFWPTPSDAGLDESIFVDYGHYTLDGARSYSERLAAAMTPIILRWRT
jgi:hypothetical protein